MPLRTIIISTFLVLNTEQRKEALSILFFSLLNILFDLFSLASIIPLFLLVLNNDNQNEVRIFLEKILGLEIDRNSLIIMMVIVLALFILKTLFTRNLIKRMSRFTAGLTEYFSKNIFKLLFNEDPTTSGDRLNHITQIPFQFVSQLVTGTFQLITSSVLISIVLVGLASFNFQVFLYILGGVLPLSVLYFYWKAKRLNGIKMNLQVKQPSLVQKVLELINGKHEILLSGNASLFEKNYVEDNRVYNDSMAQLKMSIQSTAKSIELIVIVGIFSLLIYLYLFEFNTAEAISLLSIYTVSAYKVIPSLSSLNISYTNIKAYEYSLEIIRNYGFPDLKYTSRVENQRFKFDGYIQVENLSFAYANTAPILSNIDLKISKLDKIAFVGKSGSGKSSLLKLLMGFYVPTAGKIYVDGKVLGNILDIPAWQANIAYVSPATFLFEGSLLDNLKMQSESEEWSTNNVLSKIKFMGMESLIEELSEGINTHVDEYGNNLSSGQKQRIGILRALLQDREIIFFDEITSNLDEKNSEAVIETIKKVATFKKTLIFATHDHKIINMVNRVITVNATQIHETEKI